MSNVLRRNRATSEAEFLHNACRIRTEVTKMVMNEKVIPKKYRYVYAIPMIDICRDLVKNANTYYNCIGEDDESFHLYERKRTALENMQDCCDNILAEMQSAREQFHIKMSVRELVVGLIVDEEDLIDILLKREEEKHTNFVQYNLTN
jgi:hypothetical protein